MVIGWERSILEKVDEIYSFLCNRSRGQAVERKDTFLHILQFGGRQWGGVKRGGVYSFIYWGRGGVGAIRQWRDPFLE